ncbi:hypothetical protein U1Q18_025553 [Sarracenia purpurea var. burkii]
MDWDWLFKSSVNHIAQGLQRPFIFIECLKAKEKSWMRLTRRPLTFELFQKAKIDIGL